MPAQFIEWFAKVSGFGVLVAFEHPHSLVDFEDLLQELVEGLGPQELPKGLLFLSTPLPQPLHLCPQTRHCEVDQHLNHLGMNPQVVGLNLRGGEA